VDRILSLLRQKKRKFKDAIAAGGIGNMSYRRINDVGEIATMLTVFFPDEAATRKVAAALGVKTVADSGWHVYNNMEQILSWTDPGGRTPMRRNMLPKTDDILSRSINLSVGVVDSGIGADFGITILSDKAEIHRTAQKFISTVKRALT